MNLILLKGFFGDFIFTGIPQAWTLTVEECFYLSAPLFAYAWRKSLKLVGTLVLLIWTVGLMLIILPDQIINYGFIPGAYYLFNYTFFGRILEFILGMGLAFSLNKKTKFRYFTVMGCTNIGLCLIILYWLAEPGGFGDQTYQGILVNNLFLPLFGILPLIWGLIHETSILRQLFSSKLLRILGESSYVFYLIHMGIFHNYLAKNGFNYFAILSILYLISILIYFGFEKPVKVWLRSFWISKV
jgi:peptidoglycan/LPS O-acetylase OafA/YrhL